MVVFMNKKLLYNLTNTGTPNDILIISPPVLKKTHLERNHLT